MGGQFIARLEFFGCGGTQRLTDSITFQSSDTMVAIVGPVTGLVIGLRPGTATIAGTGKRYGGLGVGPVVTVR